LSLLKIKAQILLAAHYSSELGMASGRLVASQAAIARYLSRDDYKKVLELLLELKPPINYKELARAAGYPEQLVKRRVDFFRSLVGFTIAVDERRLGLTTIAAHLKEPYVPDEEFRVKGLDEALKWILRWQANAYFPSPHGILLFYSPAREDVVEDVIARIRQRLNVAKLFELDVVVQGRPSLSSLKITSNGLKTDWPWVRELVRERRRSGALLSKKPGHAALDLLDVLILSALQLDATATIREVAKQVGFPPARVRRHTLNHISDTIEGIRPKAFLLHAFSQPVYVYAHGEGDPERVEALLEGIRKTFNFLSGGFNLTSGTFAFVFASRREELFEVTEAISEIASIASARVSYSVLALDSMKAYTYPFLAFSRESKQWDVRASAIELMKAKLKSLLSGG